MRPPDVSGNHPHMINTGYKSIIKTLINNLFLCRHLFFTSIADGGVSSGKKIDKLQCFDFSTQVFFSKNINEFGL